MFDRKKWREENKEYIKNYNKSYSPKNRKKINENSARYRKNNPEKMQDYHLRRTYGITLEQRNDLIKSQDNKCKSCGINFESIDSMHVCIDHDHNTNQIRGILCRACNTSLGLLKEDPNKIKSLLEYSLLFKIKNG